MDYNWVQCSIIGPLMDCVFQCDAPHCFSGLNIFIFYSQGLQFVCDFPPNSNGLLTLKQFTMPLFCSSDLVWFCYSLDVRLWEGWEPHGATAACHQSESCLGQCHCYDGDQWANSTCAWSLQSSYLCSYNPHAALAVPSAWLMNALAANIC